MSTIETLAVSAHGVGLKENIILTTRITNYNDYIYYYNEEENKDENHVIDDNEKKEDLNLKKSMRRAPTPETEVKMIARTFFVPSVITSSSCWENGC